MKVGQPIPETHSTVLAIDPYHKGFGFMVMDGPQCPADWGLKLGNRLNNLIALLDRYRPTVLILEEPHGASRQNRETQQFLHDLQPVCRYKDVRIEYISRKQVRVAFDARNKYEVAKAIATLFPDVSIRLPAPRKIYESEDERINIFDAAALALTYYLHINTEEKKE